MNSIDWLDTNDIAIELSEKFPEIDPQWISFPDLHNKICNLDGFIGDPNKSCLLYTSPSPRDRG